MQGPKKYKANVHLGVQWGWGKDEHTMYRILKGWEVRVTLFKSNNVQQAIHCALCNVVPVLCMHTNWENSEKKKKKTPL